MATTYPITLPSSPGFSSAQFQLLTSQVRRRSPFTFKGPGYWWGGEAWMFALVLPAMRRFARTGQRSAEDWNSALLRLDGEYGTCYFSPPVAKVLRGNATGGTPRVNGANQSGELLITDGWTAGQYLLNGDWVQVAATTSGYYGLHRLVEDCVADGSGNMTLVLRPHVGLPGRTPYANDALITVSAPKGVFALAPGQGHNWSVDRLKNYDVSFSLIEVPT